MSTISAGIVFVAIISAGFLVVGWVWRLRLRNLRRATVTDCAGVAALPAGVPCQVTGTAHGVQSAPFSGTLCAWYRVRATAKTPTGKSVFMDEKSKMPFYLQDESGHFTVEPATAAVDGAVQTMDENRPANGTLPGLASSKEVKEYRYEEWILPAGAPLYILGTATGTSIGKDKETGQYAISTRTRSQYGRRAVLFTGIGYGGGAVLFLGAALIAVLDHLD